MVCRSPQLRKENQHPLCSLSWQFLLHQFAVEETRYISGTEQTCVHETLLKMLKKNTDSSLKLDLFSKMQLLFNLTIKSESKANTSYNLRIDGNN
jgi:hypothetical protein